MAKSTVETLAADVAAIFNEYEEDVQNMTKDAVKQIGLRGKQALKSASGVFNGTKYAGGWSLKVEMLSRAFPVATLYNGKLPGLPHLLEKGHAQRGGGRVSGTVHIQPVEDELNKAFEQELRNKL